MSRDVELAEAGGLAYRSAGSGRPLVLLRPPLDGLSAEAPERRGPVVARWLAETAP